MNWLRTTTITAACALLTACSPSNSNDGGTSDAGADGAVSSRCLTAVLPQCDRGADPYSDEACFALDDVQSRNGVTIVSDTRAPSISVPVDGAQLPSATPVTVRWSTSTALLPQRTPSRWNVAVGLAPPLRAPRAPSALEELARWSTLVPEAHAHCAPFSGIGYALDFTTTNGVTGRETVLLHVEQSATEYTVGAAAWEVLRNAGGPITIRIAATRFRNSTVSDGPFESSARHTFTIAP